MLQYFAQIACMATVDAVRPPSGFADPIGDSQQAARDYQRQCWLRKARVQLQSPEIGEHIYHPSRVHVTLRNQVLRAKTPQDWYDHPSWLYGKGKLAEIPLIVTNVSFST